MYIHSLLVTAIFGWKALLVATAKLIKEVLSILTLKYHFLLTILFVHVLAK